MSTSSVKPPATACNSLQDALQAVATALAGTSLEVLCRAVGKDDTVVCKVRSGQANVSLTDAVRLMMAAGLKVVPVDRVCVDARTYDAVTTIAERAMADPECARRLLRGGQ